ncbi:MAG: hypothetical protein PVG35_04825 [Desulfobacterales bacterium]|jgi:hypothetical protein
MATSSKDVIDAHAHSGVLDRSMAQSFEDYRQQLGPTDIGGAALFSPFLEIFDRCDFHFTDSVARQDRRRPGNTYLLRRYSRRPSS